MCHIPFVQRATGTVCCIPFVQRATGPNKAFQCDFEYRSLGALETKHCHSVIKSSCNTNVVATSSLVEEAIWSYWEGLLKLACGLFLLPRVC